MMVEITVQTSKEEFFSQESCSTEGAVAGVIAKINQDLGRYEEGTFIAPRGNTLESLLEVALGCEWVVTVRYGNPFA